MKQGKEILQKHLKQMNMEKSPVDRLKPLLPAEIKSRKRNKHELLIILLCRY